MIIRGIDYTDADLPAIPVRVDASGHPQVDVLTLPVVTVAKQGVAWKNINYSNLNLPAGTSGLTVATCPANEVWNIKCFSVMGNWATPANFIGAFEFSMNGVVFTHKHLVPPEYVNLRLISYPVDFWLTNCNLTYWVQGAAAGDDFYFRGNYVVYNP